MKLNLARTHSKWTLLLAIAAVSACATKSEVRVESNPDSAEVMIVDSSRAIKRVGSTPMTLNSENAPQLFKEPLQISVMKEGFKSTSVLLPETSVNAQGRVVVQLRRDDAQLLNGATESVAEAQRMVFKKRYPEAERLLQESISKFPSVSVLHSLLGNVFYLQKNTARALESYQRAQMIDPNNAEVGKMIQKLKGIQSPTKEGI